MKKFANRVPELTAPQEDDIFGDDLDGRMRYRMVRCFVDKKLADEKGAHRYRKAHQKFCTQYPDYCRDAGIDEASFRKVAKRIHRKGFSIQDLKSPPPVASEPPDAAASGKTPSPAPAAFVPASSGPVAEPVAAPPSPEAAAAAAPGTDPQTASEVPAPSGTAAAPSPAPEAASVASRAPSTPGGPSTPAQKAPPLSRPATNGGAENDDRQRWHRTCDRLNGLADRLQTLLGEVRAADRRRESAQARAEQSSRRRQADDRREILDALTPVPRRLKGIEDTIDQILGRLGAIEEIRDRLDAPESGDPSLLAPISDDEALIVELAAYGRKVLDQLTLAARHYARHREAITHAAIEQRHGERERLRREARAQGVAEGRRQVIEDLAGQFADLDLLFDSDREVDRVLCSFLRNHGLRRHDALRRNATVDIAPETRGAYEPLARFRDTGRHRISRSCFLLEGRPIRTAALDRLDDDPQDAGPEGTAPPRTEKEQG